MFFFSPLEMKEVQPHRGLAGAGVCFGGAEGIRGEPCALLVVAGGLPLASPVGKRVWRGAARRAAGDEGSKSPARAVRNRWRLLWHRRSLAAI